MENILYTKCISNGKPVIGGLFRMSDTYGYSLVDSLKELKDKDFIFCADDFIFDALTVLWDDEKIIKTLEEAYRDLGLDISYDDLERKVKLIIFRAWNKKETFQALGIRMIKSFRKENNE